MHNKSHFGFTYRDFTSSKHHEGVIVYYLDLGLNDLRMITLQEHMLCHTDNVPNKGDEFMEMVAHSSEVNEASMMNITTMVSFASTLLD